MYDIKKLASYLEDEIDDIKKYSIEALKLKTQRPQLAQTYHELALEEYGHYSKLHEQTEIMIAEIKESKKQIPEKMFKKYEYVHKYLIEKLADAKTYMDMFDNTAI